MLSTIQRAASNSRELLAGRLAIRLPIRRPARRVEPGPEAHPSATVTGSVKPAVHRKAPALQSRFQTFRLAATQVFRCNWSLNPELATTTPAQSFKSAATTPTARAARLVAALPAARFRAQAWFPPAA